MDDEPKIPAEMLARWQRVVDITARLLNVPAGLIMKRAPPEHHVFVASSGADNPYDLETRFTLNTGLYCDEVMDERRRLTVTDATTDPVWNANPDLEHGMSFYIGLPLEWPDGSLFGTICVLDTHKNDTALTCADLLTEFRDVVVSDLRLLVEMTERMAAQRELQTARDELERRVAERTQKLADANRDLEEANTALKVLLGRVEESKSEFEAQVIANMNELILPYVEKLKRRVGDDRALAYLSVLEANLNEITAPFASQLSAKFSRLTPTELEVAKLVMQGKATKSIAEILCTATSTVEFHRNNIRKKCGIRSTSVNLKTYLTSLH